MLIKCLRLLAILCLLPATGGAGTIVDSWAVDSADGIAVSSYFSNTAGVFKTPAGFAGLWSGIDGLGALSTPDVPPAWPYGYPSSYNEFIASQFRYTPRTFNLLPAGSSLRIRAMTAQAGSLSAGAMFAGVASAGLSNAVYAGASFGLDFSTLATNPLSSNFARNYGSRISAVTVDPAVQSNKGWLDLDVTVTYDAFANQLVLHLNEWSLYDTVGTLVLADALDPSFQGSDVRYDLAAFPSGSLLVQPAFLGLEHVNESPSIINATRPMWDQFSIAYTTVPEPGSLFLLLASGVALMGFRSRVLQARGGSGRAVRNSVSARPGDPGNSPR